MNDQFDHNIRSRIYSVESDVPDHLWGAVDQQLRPKRDRRWWFLFLLPVLAGLYWGLAGSQDWTPDDNATHDQKNEKIVQIATASTPEKMITDSRDVKMQGEKQQSTRQTRSLSTSSAEGISNTASTPTSSNYQITQVHTANQNLNVRQHQSDIAEKTKQIYHQRPSPFNPSMSAQRDLIEILPNLKQYHFYPKILLKDPKIDVCPSFSSRLSISPFAEFSVSGGLPYKSLETKDPELMDFKTIRERTEKERSSFTVQGLIGIDIGKRFELKTGLSATRIYEVFDYFDESASRTITNIITDTIIINGEPEIRTDTSIVTQYGQRIKLSQNRYTTLDLPLLAAYKFKVQGHQFFLQAGAIYNLALWTKGDLLSPDEDIINIDYKSPSTASVFKKRVGLDLTASLGYELELSEGNQLRILCSLRRSIGDYSVPQYPLSQRYQHVHLGVSWKHQF